MKLRKMSETERYKKAEEYHNRSESIYGLCIAVFILGIFFLLIHVFFDGQGATGSLGQLVVLFSPSVILYLIGSYFALKESLYSNTEHLTIITKN